MRMPTSRYYCKWRFFLLLIVAIGLLPVDQVQATNYVFPTKLPPGCSGSNGSYTCSALSLGYEDKITVAAPVPAIITVNGDLTTNGKTRINTGGPASDLTLVVTGTLYANYEASINANVTAGAINDTNGKVTFGGSLTTVNGSINLGYETTVAGDVTSSGGAINIGQGNEIGGDVSSATGAITIGYEAEVKGGVSGSGTITLAQGAEIDGKIAGGTGNVSIGYEAKVEGSITTSSGTISFAQNSRVSSCVTSTQSATITLGYHASINSVCCGSSCGTACVVNNSNYSMPSRCEGSDGDGDHGGEEDDDLAVYYRMDEVQWNGGANEIKDNVGSNHMSRIVNGGGSSTTSSGTPSPTIASQHANVSGGFCNAGYFDGNAYLKTASAPAALQNSSEITMAAWVYPTAYTSGGLATIASNDVRGEFHLNADGTVNFWTSVSSFNSSSTVPLNQWSHVAVTFKKGEQKIYINGASAGSASVNSNLPSTNSCPFIVGGDVATGASCSIINERNFHGWIDEVWVANKALSRSEIDAIRLTGRTCSTSSGSVTPHGFNCVEAGANALSGRLYTKLAGTAFAFDVVALKDSNNDNVADAIATTYASDVDRSVSVELVDASSGASCSAYPALSPAVGQTLTFAKSAQSSEQGRKSAAAMTVAKAYPNLRCRVTDASQASPVVGCSTDNFAVRPTVFSVSSNADGSSTVKAGANFTLTAASGTVGYNGTPTLDTSRVGAHSGAVATGALAGSFGAADSATGAAIGSAFSYSEVGLFSLAAQGVYDDTFTAVDSANGDCTDDFSNASISGLFGCKFGNPSATSGFGRFIPDHFDVTLNTPSFAPACSTFTYVGQPVKYATRPVATLTAKNTSSATTHNYTGGYWKIDPNHATYGIAPGYSEASQPLTVLNSGAPSAVDNGNGTGTLSFADTTSNILAVTRGAPMAPFDAEIALSFTLRDTDAVAVANVNGAAGANPVSFGAASAGNGMAFTGGNKSQRWGRLVLQNVFGSELTALTLPLFSEYYNGTAFVRNTADNCTNLGLSTQLQLSNPVTAGGAAQAGNAAMTIAPSGTTQATLAHATLASGDAGLSFSSPGAGNTGYVDVAGNFASLPWLLFDWDHDGAQDDSPSARATFGVYKGNSQQIYLREVY